METRARKKLRENNDAYSVRPILTPTIPSLVSHIFLTNLRDVNLLKSCRLVCKSWNVDACESLRAFSKVFLKEHARYDDIIRMTKLLQKRESERWKHFPSSVQDFDVEAYDFTESDFIELVHLPSISISSLTFHLSVELDQSQLGLILVANQKTITELTIVAENANNRSYEKLIAFKEINPKVLKSLTFEDRCEHCINHVHFAKNIVSVCRLERVDLTISDEEILISLLTQNNVKNLKHLKIRLRKTSAKALNHLRKLKFPILKSLTFETSDLLEKTVCLQHLCLFYESVSSTVKDFVTNFPIKNKMVLSFPQLKTIKLSNNSVMSALNPDSFPALSKVCLDVTKPLLTNLGNDVVPHHGVQSLVISIENQPGTFQNENDLFNRDLLMLLTYLSKQFPQVCTLVFSHENNWTNLMAIHETFPKLTTLGLDGYCHELNFCDFRCPQFRKLERDGSIERNRIRKSIIDFTELERIFFYKKFKMHRHIMSLHCLGDVPKLRQISFHWDDSLTANLLRKSVSHVDKIFISAPYGSKEITKLSMLRPNVYSRQVKYPWTKPFPAEEGFDF